MQKDRNLSTSLFWYIEAGRSGRGVIPTSIYRSFFFCGGVKVWGWRSVREGIQVSVPANCRAFAEVTVRSRDACFFISDYFPDGHNPETRAILPSSGLDIHLGPPVPPCI